MARYAPKWHYYCYAAEQGREGKGITLAPFPSSREGSGREEVGTTKEGKGLPIIPFLPSRVRLII